jgi:hypothetical protein
MRAATVTSKPVSFSIDTDRIDARVASYSSRIRAGMAMAWKIVSSWYV